MKRILAVAVALLALTGCCNKPKTAVYLDPTKPIEERVEDALARMTLEEKVALCHAQSKFSSRGVPRLGIPDNWATDGPHGIRNEVLWDEWYGAGQTNDSCTAFPALTALAATWNPDMALRYGRAIGEEARYRNKNILLGPGVNIYRMPLNGRNFEYMGEDPYLASRMVVPYVEGVQENKVAACVKHFALNNQEHERHGIDVEVDDRTLYEIYLPAFRAAVVEGGAWAVMGSYNRYKGLFCCHNNYLLQDVLRDEWGFDGVTISDWGGTHDTDQAIANGLDMEFGTWTDGMGWSRSDAYSQYYLADAYIERLRDGRADQKTLDEKARNILRLIFRTTMAPDRPYGSFVTPEHSEVARRIAEEGIVLLKNERQVLPIEAGKVKSILVVGENGCKSMTIGGGSSSLKAAYEVSPLEGIKARAGNDFEILYAEGYSSPKVAPQDVKGAVRPKQERIDYDALRNEAVEMARKADMVVVFGGLNKNENQDCEGDDRKSYGLPYMQDELIAALAEVNDNIAVVIISGNAVAMPWIESVPAVVEGWFSGSEAGNALAAVLFGDRNPSGKLPFTFPVVATDNGALAFGAESYPGVDHKVIYKEGILVGYRWHDAKHIEPLFPFGHGLSYTTFEYSNPRLNRSSLKRGGKCTLSIDVTNTGDRDGEEVVQLYVGDDEVSVVRPPKELKHFEKIALGKGEKRTVKFTVTEDDLKFFDANSHSWCAEKGTFTLYVGSSSRDIRATEKLTLM